jgi:hypothetical protein
MKPPPYVLSQGVLAAIGNALSQAFAVGIGTSYEASKPQHEARPRVPSVKQRSKAHVCVTCLMQFFVACN